MGSRGGRRGSGGRIHKPVLIDPAEEGTKPRGVDGAWWAYLLSGWVQQIMPRRLRGLPPLFYLPSIVGILWGTAFLFFRISRLPIPAGVVLEPAPPMPNAVLDVMAIAMAASGIVQGVGTLYRKQWGLMAAYLWFAFAILWCWLGFGSLPEQAASGRTGGAFVLLASTATLVAFVIYYHNRRQWFGISGGR